MQWQPQPQQQQNEEFKLNRAYHFIGKIICILRFNWMLLCACSWNLNVQRNRVRTWLLAVCVYNSSKKHSFVIFALNFLFIFPSFAVRLRKQHVVKSLLAVFLLLLSSHTLDRYGEWSTVIRPISGARSSTKSLQFGWYFEWSCQRCERLNEYFIC